MLSNLRSKPRSRLNALPFMSLLLLAMNSFSEATMSYRYAKPCPTDASVVGYTSIDELNMEMKRHRSIRDGTPLAEDNIVLITLPGTEEEQELLSQGRERYIYKLCPNTVFHSSTTQTGSGENKVYNPIIPLLDGTTIQCGNHGQSKDNCILEGISDDNDTNTGSNSGSFTSPQVLLIDTVESEDLYRVFVFQGITFTKSQDVSVAAFASTWTRAEFYDCHWKDSLTAPSSPSSSLMSIAKAHAVPLPESNPDISFQFDNIFSRRQRYLYPDPNAEIDMGNEGPTATEETATGVTESMSVMLAYCTIENSGRLHNDGEEEFSLIYNQGSLEIFDSKFLKNKGMFIINTIRGGNVHILDNTIFYKNHVSGSVIRTMEDSSMTIENKGQIDENNVLIFDSNVADIALIATVSNSATAIDSIVLQNNDIRSNVQLLVLEDSQVSLANSCWLDQSASKAVITDSTSSFQESSNAFEFLESRNEDEIISLDSDVEGALCESSSAGFLYRLDSLSPIDCFEKGTCNGTCQTLQSSTMPKTCQMIELNDILSIDSLHESSDGNQDEMMSSSSSTTSNISSSFAQAMLYTCLLLVSIV